MSPSASGIPTFELPTIDEAPRFGSPGFMEELRTVVGVDHRVRPGFTLEWMASDDLSCGTTESISGTFEATICTCWSFHCYRTLEHEVAGPLLQVLANMNATGLGVLRPRQ
jgi:hypothetical protein